ncbi:MAG: haloacid dehalogenase-like hydrolase [Lentisphaerae bacterium]|nr:haloacid dehalogenase-like hydrolase [Lentisphaerota bacterium]
MHIGVDFDNTLVSYDALFYRCARERRLIPAELTPTKAAVREWLWRQPEGNTVWTQLQGEVYGARMAEAVWFPGADTFLSFCRRRGLAVFIISHKLKYPALGPRVNLREAALSWMETHGFFSPGGFGLESAAVCFEDSREHKLERIGERQCTCFIEDLLEVLSDPAFPSGVIKILFDPAGEVQTPPNGISAFRSWGGIQSYVETLL